MNLLKLDTQTLIGVMVWGNLAMAIIVYLYRLFHSHMTNFNVFRNMATIRFLTAAGFLLLFLRDTIPDILSVNVGNTLLFLCYFLEARLLLEVTGLLHKKIDALEKAIFSFSILSFNVIEFLYHTPSRRIAMASILIFALWLPTAIALITTKNSSKFKSSISIFYIFLLSVLVIRSIVPFYDNTLVLHTTNYYQTLFFIALNLMMIVNIVIYLLFMKMQDDALIEKMAYYDHLTNLLNRYSFYERGNRILENNSKSSAGLSMLFFDLDYFKEANDTYGHQFGDEVLLAFADILQTHTRPGDLCCRYGGEEFIVLLTDTKTIEGKMIANRILQAVERHTFLSQPAFHITTSIGFLRIDPQNTESLDANIQKADQALYYAKQMGRNKIVDYAATVKMKS